MRGDLSRQKRSFAGGRWIPPVLLSLVFLCCGFSHAAPRKEEFDAEVRNILSGVRNTGNRSLTNKAVLELELVRDKGFPLRSFLMRETFLHDAPSLYARTDHITATLDTLYPGWRGHEEYRRIIDGYTDTLRKGTVRLRSEAAMALGRSEDRDVIYALMSALGDPAAEVRVATLSALHKLADKRSRKKVEAALFDEDSNVRRAAAAALERIGDRKSLPALREALDDQNDDVRRAVVKAVDHLGSPRQSEGAAPPPATLDKSMLADGEGFDSLVELLVSNDHETMRKATAKLEGLVNHESIPLLLKALDHRSPEVRRTVLYLIERVYVWDKEAKPDHSALTKIAAVMEDDDKLVRQYAANLLGKIGIPAVDHLLAVLRKGDRDSRIRAARALGVIGYPRAGEALLRILEEEDLELARAAIWALGEMKHERAGGPITSYLESRDPETRYLAAEALGKIGDRTAVEPLVTALRDADVRVRKYAAKSLGELGGRRAADALAALLEDNPGVEEWGLHALVLLKDPRVIPHLAPLLLHSDHLVRQDASRSIRALGEAAYGPLVRLLSHENYRLRKAVAAELERIGWQPGTPDEKVLFGIATLRYAYLQGLEEKAVDPLLALLKSEDPMVKVNAAGFLAETGSARAVKPLIDAMSTLESRTQRAWIADALSRITGKSLGTEHRSWLDWWEDNAGEANPFTCFSAECHAGMAAKKYVHLVTGHADDPNGCLLCHNPSRKFDREKHRRGLARGFRITDPSTTPCFACHQAWAEKALGYEFVHRVVEFKDCIACHDPHQSDYRFLLKKSNANELCPDCHKYQTLPDQFVHEPFSAGDCTACHRTHASKRRNLLNDDSEELCRRCHSGNNNAISGFKEHVQPGEKCLDCHLPHMSSKKFLLKTM